MLTVWAAWAIGGVAWRSELYPADWRPPTEVRQGVRFDHDRFLQDFSGAGANGGAPLPRRTGPVFEPAGLDPTGRADATAAIQTALDRAAAAGGGVVRLPAGTFRIALPPGAEAALVVRASGVVLRGAGPEATRIVDATPDRRGKAALRFEGPAAAGWRGSKPLATPLARDLETPHDVLPVASVEGFRRGDWVLVRMRPTLEWVREHRVPGWEGHQDRLGGIVYPRQVTAVDPAARTLKLDGPTRHTLRVRDGAEVVRSAEPIHGVGVEDLAIGQTESPSPDGWGEEEYTNPDRAAYRHHAAAAIAFARVRDGWIRRVRSFAPKGNRTGAHLASNGVVLTQCRAITVQDVRMARPQFGGGGGNGYMFRLSDSADCLVVDSVAEFNRHGFVLSGMAATGNVFHRCVDRETGFATGGTGRIRTAGRGSDHHMHFSHANLFDRCTADASDFQAAYRPYGSDPKHHLTAAHSVYWNVVGEGTGGAVVRTAQARFGYVIGTSGARPTVDTSSLFAAATDPVDHVEGVGRGGDLVPPSLIEDQRRRRFGPGRAAFR